MERIRKTNRLDSKGQMRVIETILASFIVVFALSFVSAFAVSPTSSKYEATDLEKMAHNILHDLDQHGLLARFVYTQDWDSIKAALRVTLPIDVYFNLTVTNLSSEIINNSTISYGDLETFASSQDVASVTYGLVGYPEIDKATGKYQTIYDPRILILQLARG